MGSARVTLYTRAGCHLCDEMKAVIQEVAGMHPLDLQEIDIDSDPTLKERFDTEVPVLFVDGRKAFKYRVTPHDLLRRLRRTSG